MKKTILTAAAVLIVTLGTWGTLAFQGGRPQPMLMNGGAPITTASLSASPTSVASGSSSTLTWGSTHAGSCTSPGSLGNTAIPSFTGATSGSSSTGALTTTTTYSVQCGTATAAATVTVTGGGNITCDFGPPYIGVIPAAATQAGFTHCAANFDFTQTQQWTDQIASPAVGGSPVTRQWSNLASWFICVAPGSSSALWGYIPYFNGVGCNTTHQNIITDTSVSPNVQVWQLSYLVSDFNAGNYNNYIAGGLSFTNMYGLTFPAEYYLEHVDTQSSTTNTCTGGSCIKFTTQMTGFDQSFCYWEDLDEINQSTTMNNAFDIQNCQSQGFQINALPAPTAGAYSTYGRLHTADNTSGMGSCDYYSAGAVYGLPANSFQACTGVISITPPGPFGARIQMSQWEGPEANPSPTTWALDYTVKIQRETVWVCPSPTGGSWQTTGQCYTSVITTHP